MASPESIIRPVARHANEPSRGTLITAAYVSRVQGGDHIEEQLGAVVTQDGIPIEQGGETLTLGLCPMENRYAIGPVIDGKAEVLEQRDFEVLHANAFLEFFAVAKHEPHNPNLRYVPKVRDFVAMKEDARNPKRIVPLGTGFIASDPPIRPVEFWSEAKQRTVSAAEVDAEEDPRDAELREMRVLLEELRDRQAGAPPTPAVVAVAEAKPKEIAPCNKEITAGFLSQHQRFCKDPACAPSEIA